MPDISELNKSIIEQLDQLLTTSWDRQVTGASKPLEELLGSFLMRITTDYVWKTPPEEKLIAADATRLERMADIYVQAFIDPPSCMLPINSAMVTFSNSFLMHSCRALHACNILTPDNFNLVLSSDNPIETTFAILRLNKCSPKIRNGYLEYGIPYTDKEKETKLVLQGSALARYGFHYAMQNPIDGVVQFEKFHYIRLPELLACLPDYFSKDGRHLFGQRIEKLIISGAYFLGYDTEYLCCFIRKNPLVRKLDLSNSGLRDGAALKLIVALNNNTRLIELSLSGNNISSTLLAQKDQIIARNIQIAENINLYANQTLSLAGLCANSIFSSTSDIPSTEDLHISLLVD